MGLSRILLVIAAALLVPTLVILATGEFHPYVILSGGIGVFLVMTAVAYTLKIGPFRQQQPEDD